MKWTAKRFWIMEAFCLFPSIYPIYSILKDGIWDLYMVAAFLFSGIVCGIYSYAYLNEVFSKLCLKIWLSYNIVFVVTMSIICIFTDISLFNTSVIF